MEVIAEPKHASIARGLNPSNIKCDMYTGGVYGLISLHTPPAVCTSAYVHHRRLGRGALLGRTRSQLEYVDMD